LIRYTRVAKGITADKLRGFFVGWPSPPSPKTHLRLLEASDELVLAIDDGTGNVVGFITALTDGILSAYIPLLEVLPPYQKRGIGTQLMNLMMKRLGKLYMVDLCTGEEMRPFYERFEMEAMVGMAIRRHDRQTGLQ
jgi:ribosomal protein S18 acetylase RimI-like enzyme